jgi:ABC-type multidrug transport system fused ATPase/permease subunit
MQVLTEMLQGIRTVKAFRAESRELERYREINASYLEHSMGMERTVATARASTILFSHFAMAGLVVGFCWISLRLNLFESGSQWMQFFGGLALAYTHVRHVLDGVTRVQSASGAADRLRAILSEAEDVVERADALPVRGLGTGIRFESVSFAYPDAECDAVADLDLAIRPGETLALVGPSGAGKSTVLDLVARFIDPRVGRITIDGRDLRGLQLDDWVGQWAMVGQVPFLFHATIEENIRYGRPEATREEVVAAARAAHVHDFILTLPHDYATQVGEAGAKLSGGQRQRITIARAILKQAPLLLLDEATSSLDTESETLVQDALDQLMRGRTVIVIAHRLSTIRRADRIAVLEAGRLVQLGTHEKLVAVEGVYARLFAMQDGDGMIPQVGNGDRTPVRSHSAADEGARLLELGRG